MAVAPDGGDLYGGDGAAVDVVVGTDDRRGGIGDEEADERGDLVGPGGAAERDVPRESMSDFRAAARSVPPA
jgi:hypothetical protein